MSRSFRRYYMGQWCFPDSESTKRDKTESHRRGRRLAKAAVRMGGDCPLKYRTNCKLREKLDSRFLIGVNKWREPLDWSMRTGWRTRDSE